MTEIGWWLVILTAGCVASANLLLRLVMDGGHWIEPNPVKLIKNLSRLAARPWFDLGIALYLVGAVIWFRIIATETLSTAYPLFISLAFVFVTLGASTLFRESITMRKLAGLGIIVIGISVVGWQ